MRALTILSLAAMIPNLAFAGMGYGRHESLYPQLMVCEEKDGDWADISVDVKTKEIHIRDLASSTASWLYRQYHDLDSVYSVRTNGLEIRESEDSSHLLELEDINAARFIKIKLAEPENIFASGNVKMGIGFTDEFVMKKDDHGHWHLSFGRSKHAKEPGYHQEIGKNCDIKLSGFFEGWGTHGKGLKREKQKETAVPLTSEATE